MVIPRVTQILKPFTEYHNVPKDVLARAASRGTTVHALCAAIAGGAWVPESFIPSECVPYVNSFIAWHKKFVQEYILIEERIQEKDERYTGQVDFVIKGKDGKVYLVDLKTSAATQKTYPLQMAAYRNLLSQKGYNIEESLLVFLNKEGEYPKVIANAEFNELDNVFLSALTCWEYFNKGKKCGK